MIGLRSKESKRPSSESGEGEKVKVSFYVMKLGLIRSLLLSYLKLRRYKKQGIVEVCYGGNGVCGMEDAVSKSLLGLFGFQVTRLGWGNTIPDYPHLHARAMETASKVTKALIPLFEKDAYYLCLKELLEDEDSSISYAAKDIARNVVFPIVREILVWRYLQGGREPVPEMRVFMPRWLPREWHSVMREYVLGDEISSGWTEVGSFASIVEKTNLILRMIFLLFKHMMKRGVGSAKIADGKAFRIICELTDPRVVGGRAQDTDYLVDGKRVTAKDVLFYVTSKQNREYLERIVGGKQLVEGMRKKGYEVVFLSELALPRAVCWKLVEVIRKTFLKLSRSRNGMRPLRNSLVSALSEYLEFAPLFEQVSGRVVLSFSHPQGWTSWRSNNGLITALCRRYGMQSVSYQNRVYWGRTYEFGFEALDLFFAWGPAWTEFLEPYLEYVRRVEYVGDIFLDDLFSYTEKCQDGGKEPGGASDFSIGVITGDIYTMHTVEYNLRLLKAAFHSAFKYPFVKMLIKPKSPEHQAVFYENSEFSEFAHRLGDRLLIFLDPRHHIERIVLSSDLLLVIGFTTPGIDAALFGKRVIYYDEMRCADDLYGRIPKLLAKTVEDVCKLVDEAVLCNMPKGEDYSGKLSQMDPFRDGQARMRINSVLFGEVNAQE